MMKKISFKLYPSDAKNNKRIEHMWFKALKRDICFV